MGRVLDELESLGLAQNTVITFMGDHGYQNGQKGEWCKCTLFELSTRVPLIVVVPDSVPAQSSSSGPLAHTQGQGKLSSLPHCTPS